MSWFANNVLRIGAAHPQTTGWSTSAVIHVLGIVVVTTWLGTRFVEGPRLPGRQSCARVELMATWTPREPPPAPPVVIDITKLEIVVLPNQTHFVEPEYEESPADVSQPTPEVLAMAHQLIPTTVDQVLPRKPPPARCCKCEPPPTREVARQMALVSLPAARATPAGAIDQLPRKLYTNPPPPYPPDAYARRQQGRVLLSVLINRYGLVDEISVSESSGVTSLDRSALETVRTWRFEPARHGGLPIPFVVTVPVRFIVRGQ